MTGSKDSENDAWSKSGNEMGAGWQSGPKQSSIACISCQDTGKIKDLIMLTTKNCPNCSEPEAPFVWPNRRPVSL